MNFETIWWEEGVVKILDQTKLPADTVIRDCRTSEDMFEAILELAVRGAPLIGVSAAFGLYLGIKDAAEDSSDAFFDVLEKQAAYLASSRPTAVNLCWALERMKTVALAHKDEPVGEIKKILFDETVAIKKEDEAMCRSIGEHGNQLILDGDTVLTHCNAGALATAGIGTALAPLYVAKAQGKRLNVYADETRPLLQGARLTAWELTQNEIPTTVICDNMAGSLLRTGEVNKIIVGADRIARNGDAANKIGTYPLAVMAKQHSVPFYVAAPYSTFDLSLKSGSEIPIEERKPDEMRSLGNKQLTPDEAAIFNPAFDVTPLALITAFITEKGIIKPPFEEEIDKTFK